MTAWFSDLELFPLATTMQLLNDSDGFRVSAMEQRHQLSVGLNGRQIRILKALIRPVKHEMAVVQHNDSWLKANQKVLVMRDQNRRSNTA